MRAATPDELRHLVEQISAVVGAGSPPATLALRDRWQGQRIDGGNNNLLYHVTWVDGSETTADVPTAHSGYAVKLTRRDERDRAGREYAALTALREAGVDVAPEPVLLERTRYALPVVVQTWIDGPVTAMPPASDDEWRRIVEHYATVHTVTPERASAALPETVLTMDGPASGWGQIEHQIAHVPEEHRPDVLRGLLGRLAGSGFTGASFETPQLALNRCDANASNFIRRAGHAAGWASVDWENAGWGDPAFEIAEWSVHPAYVSVAPERWAWVLDTYLALSGRDDPTFRGRVRVYTAFMLVWWVARLARALYEIPRGMDQRLPARVPSWSADTQLNLQEYARRASAALSRAE